MSSKTFNQQRVAITGMGIVSCLGNDINTVCQSLQLGKSGIRFNSKYAEMGLRSNVSGSVDIRLEDIIPRKNLRFMGNAAGYAYVSLSQAIDDANLPDELISNYMTGLIMGSGGASPKNQVEASDILRSRGVKRIGPYRVPQTMGSTVSANLATAFRIKGISYSITSACSTSLHCIGVAYDHIMSGRQNVMFVGGGEEEHWSLSCLFDAMGALSSKYNSTPTSASRPYDIYRDGFVIAGGGGALVLENYNVAKARGAPIHAEIIGYGVTSDGEDMVNPSGEGATRCIKMALHNQPVPVDYINSHGTSTPAGDIVELNAIKKAFNGQEIPYISSTKSISGHSQGASGVQEIIFCLLMMRENFISPSANIQNIDPIAAKLPIVTQKKDKILNLILSNSFGFGGTNASILLKKHGFNYIQ